MPKWNIIYNNEQHIFCNNIMFMFINMFEKYFIINLKIYCFFRFNLSGVK